jgi:phosphomannomutase
LYFAAGSLDAPGAMFTASHNPAQYNGIKFCLSGARPVGVDSGLNDIREVAVRELARPSASVASRGQLSQRNLLDAFADHVVSFVDQDQLIPLKVVADTANGMGGLVVPAVCERLPQIQLEVMFGELDGTFPTHPADPIQPANQKDLQAQIASGKITGNAIASTKRLIFNDQLDAALTAFFLIVSWIVVIETARICVAYINGKQTPTFTETPYQRTQLVD